ncbi:MAG: DMT family transporter, partial [Nocardiopsaceae bacterium]|nr:DMT family transporter [Nocardiopsaceae bacterium]
MYYLIAVLAAVLLGTGFVLQQAAAQQAPQSAFLRARLLAVLIRRPRWLAGIASMVSGQLLAAWVIGHIELSLAEPLLATNLLFALVLAGPLSRQALHKSEVAGAVILVAGVTALSLARSTPTGGLSVGSVAYWPYPVAVLAGAAYCFARLGRRRAGGQRATLTGVSAGLVFGIQDALTRETVRILDTGQLVTLLTSWQSYALLVVAILGLWLMESAFSAAPLHASLPAITAAEPVAGIMLGIVVFGDTVQVTPGLIAVQLCGLVALVAGVILVARAPALARLRPPHLPHPGGVPHPHVPGSRRDRAAGAGQSPGEATHEPTGAGQSPGGATHEATGAGQSPGGPGHEAADAGQSPGQATYQAG